MDSSSILQLFDNVLARDIEQFNIREEDIMTGIKSMRDVYMPDVNTIDSNRSVVANYNDPAHRCAYLHKYASLHTSMVRDFLYRAIHQNYRFFYNQVFSHSSYSICCLGGGPGNDVIAALSAFHLIFSYFPVSATVVDYMLDWKYSFISILQELGSGHYGAFGSNTHHFLNWKYLFANLLKPFSESVKEAIASASLITMVKFVSATCCKDTEDMINNVFYYMKPGAVVLFIDNASGGFYELIVRAALKQNLISIYGPLRHFEYLNPDVKIKRFGFVRCHRVTVAVEMFMKPYLPEDPYSPQRKYHSAFPQFSCRLPSPPPKMCADSPLTPYIYVAETPEVQDFAEDVAIKTDVAEFSSPAEELPQSSRNSILVSCVAIPDNSRLNASILQTPNTGTPRGKRRKKTKARCLPVSKWRRQVTRKIHQMKSRCRTVLLKKPGKQHPVFRL